jgi:hypothetical protein
MPRVYVPTVEMQRIAQRVLELRASLPASRRAGTDVGLARARDIANRRPLALHTVVRMVSFFARHGAAPGSAEARQDQTSKAAQAWALWGGTPGRVWARDIVRRARRRHRELLARARAARTDDQRDRLLDEARALLAELRG